MRARLGVPIAVLCATLVMPARTTLAQSDDDWHSSFTPYGWMAGMTGLVGFAGSAANVNLGFSDILENLDMSVMALLEIGRGRWMGRLDATFVAVSDSRAVEEGSESTVILEFEQTMLQPEIGYTVVQQPWGGIDLLGGGRYWHPKIDVSADAPGGSVDIGSGSRSWFDGTGGVRVRYNPAERWHLFAKGDVGAGGSKLTWQAFGGLGWDVSGCCALMAAYKHLDVNYERDALVSDNYTSGAALGFEIRF
jgi:hypothetical protein